MIPQAPPDALEAEVGARARVMHQLEGAESEVGARFGLGRSRSVMEYERFAGVDFTRRTFSNLSKRGGVNEGDFMHFERTNDTKRSVLAMLGIDL